MNNITLEKMSNIEGDTLYLRIFLQSNSISVKQDFLDIYISDLLAAKYILLDYFNNNQEVCIEISDAFNNTGDSDFSIKVFPKDLTGHLQLEVNIKVDIDYNYIKHHSHKCCFFIDTEIGALERFERKLNTLIVSNVGTKISLYD